MEVVLKKRGNITALMIPASILKALRISAGQCFTLDITTDRKIILTPKRKFALTDLIAQCDLTAPPPADLTFWGASVRSGQEIL